jgi:hypothetical protein
MEIFLVIGDILCLEYDPDVICNIREQIRDSTDICGIRGNHMWCLGSWTE